MTGDHLDQHTYAKGRAIRSAVLGEDHVNDAMSSADEFSRPLQDLVTEYCWGAVWGRDGLPLRTRSLLNVAMLAVLNRPQQLRIHLLGALNNGVTREELREVLLQVSIYAGVPAAVEGFRIASDTFAELDTDE